MFPKTWFSTVVAVALLCSGSTSPAEENPWSAPSTAERAMQVSTSALVGACLARSEEAVCRSLVNSSHVRGAFGEIVMEKVVLGSPQAGGWRPVSMSPQPQGIDGLYIRHDKVGNPRGLLVGEAKFGKSRVNITRDGWQLSERWSTTRLRREAARYIQASQDPVISFEPCPFGIRETPDIVEVSLRDGRAARFWRRRLGDEWKYDGPNGTVVEAQRRAGVDGKYIKDAADGKIRYRSRLFKIDVKGNDVTIQIADAQHVGDAEVAFTAKRTLSLSASEFGNLANETQQEVAGRLLRKLPHLSEDEARDIAGAVVSKRNLEEIARQQQRDVLRSIMLDAGGAAVAGGALSAIADVGFQLYGNQQIRWDRALASSVIGGASAGVGALSQHAVVQLAIRNELCHQFFARTATALGLPNGAAAANLAGKAVGGGLGGIALAAGLYASGNITVGEAMSISAYSVTGAITFAAAEGAIVGLAVTVGTTSTGVAISSLSGAAATNAAMAWLGGGAVAAGGGGMAAGACVVTGGAAVVAVAATLVIQWGVGAYDESRISKRAEVFSTSLLHDHLAVKRCCIRCWHPALAL